MNKKEYEEEFSQSVFSAFFLFFLSFISFCFFSLSFLFVFSLFHFENLSFVLIKENRKEMFLILEWEDNKGDEYKVDIDIDDQDDDDKHMISRNVEKRKGKRKAKTGLEK